MRAGLVTIIDPGNRLSGPTSGTTYTYDDDDRMFSSSYGVATYDNNGSLISRTRTVNGVTTLWTYSYDYENRLTSAVKQQNGVTKITANYKYDALGRRVFKSTVIVQPTNQTETKNYYYIYDGEDIAQERIEFYLDEAAQSLTVNTYLHGPGIDEPLYMNKVVSGVSGDYYYHADALGSVLDITDSNQNVQEWYVYKSFGEVTRTGNLYNRHTYTGRELDPETGLIYYRARYYDPTIGRFTTKDPIGYGGGFNKYIYVGDNPVRWTDPWGLKNWGNAFGQALEGMAGNAIGYGLDALGMIFDSSGNGAYYGAAAGGAVGAYYGAHAGGFFGAFAGGIVGGAIGGWFGGHFDGPCAGQLNCDESLPPNVPVPFNPMECR